MRSRSKTFAMLRRLMEAQERQVQAAVAERRREVDQATANHQEAETMLAAYGEEACSKGGSVDALMRTRRFRERVQMLKALREHELVEAHQGHATVLNTWRTVNLKKKAFAQAQETAETEEARALVRKMRRSANPSGRTTQQSWSMLKEMNEQGSKE